MASTFRQRLKKLILFLILGFVALFLFRLAYGYTLTFSDNLGSSSFFDNINGLRRNYASKEYAYESKSNSSSQGAMTMDQKYEKVAQITTKSSQFDPDEKQARQRVEQHKALIQFEQKSGNTGNRQLNMVIGVPPENFDSLYQQLIRIGKVKAKQITKNDKTNEYKELNARKISLEQTRSSLIDLKAKSGKIEEYMQLENRILDIEQQLQALGVSLGDFDDENEFCTVHFSLREGKERKIGFLQRVKVALEWTVGLYLQIMALLFCLSAFAYFVLLILEKIKGFDRFFKE